MSISDFCAKNREKLSRFFFENLAFFFGSHSWPDSGKEGIWWRVSLVARLIWAPLIIFNLFMGGYLLLRKRINLLALSTLFMTIVLASQFTSIFEGRYRKPLELLLIKSVPSILLDTSLLARTLLRWK